MPETRSSMNVCGVEFRRKGEMICLPFVEMPPSKDTALLKLIELLLSTQLIQRLKTVKSQGIDHYSNY